MLFVDPRTVATSVDQGEIVERVQIEIARQVELLTASVREKSRAIKSVARFCVPVVQTFEPGHIIYREGAVGADKKKQPSTLGIRKIIVTAITARSTPILNFRACSTLMLFSLCGRV